MFVLLALIIIFSLFAFEKRKKLKSVFRFFFQSYFVIIFGIFVAGVAVDVMGFGDGFLYDQLIQAASILIMGSPFAFWKRSRIKKENKEQAIQQTDGTFNASTKERQKIVEEFNKKYRLNLTDTQINNIVDGSFQNKKWEEEIMAMNQRYISVNEWYRGDTGWLRVYLRAFSVQTISSDFEYQKEICLSIYEDIFSSMHIENFASTEDCIRNINQKYLTNFEEAEFMVAYRFLQQNGRKYTLPRALAIENVSEIEALAKKYDEAENMQNVSGNVRKL